jgi:hypothetical protein
VHDAFAREDPASEWIQVTDSSGVMAAAANWRLESGVDEAKKTQHDKERAEKEAPQTLSLFAAGAQEWAKIRDEFFANQRHFSQSLLGPSSSIVYPYRCDPLLTGSAELVVLVVHPKFQRRGA